MSKAGSSRPMSNATGRGHGGGRPDSRVDFKPMTEIDEGRPDSFGSKRSKRDKNVVIDPRENDPEYKERKRKKKEEKRKKMEKKSREELESS